jgi:microcystin-dependent protein
MLDIKDISLILLIFAVVYLYYKTRNIKSSENFTTTSSVSEQINDYYKVDLDAMRNLGSISQSILNNNDTLIIPSNITKIKNLEVDGDVKFINKDNNIMEIFPQYMIMAWYNFDDTTHPIPKGWAPCDGNYYIIGTDGRFMLVDEYYPNKIKTPDLRGRVIVGSGIGKDESGNLLTERKLNDFGGEEKHILTINEIPSHDHTGIPRPADNCFRGGECDGSRTHVSGSKNTNKTGGNSDGTTQPHNNMQPYYVISYIIKLL